ncbi:MAG: 2,3,4,5-tetrahydropyridine-2,6-dicarboxylate N-succinyltransferase [Pikeienuella sp.]
MEPSGIKEAIEAAWEHRDTITPETAGPARDAVGFALQQLDRGQLRVAAPDEGGTWVVNDWAKKAVLLSFRLTESGPISNGPGESDWWDKVPSKFAGWSGDDWRKAGFRAVPTCVVRYSAFIAPGVVLMPCFVNVGAHVGEGTMIDTWATVGSCAQIGKNVHISGGTGIGGVLEPLQAQPVIVEDDVFVGARSELVEGVIVRQGAVIGMGVFLGASTPIIDRETGEVVRGEVPPFAVVLPGTLPGKPLPDGSPGPHMPCAVIVKRVDAGTRAKTAINELLRD